MKMSEGGMKIWKNPAAEIFRDDGDGRTCNWVLTYSTKRTSKISEERRQIYVARSTRSNSRNYGACANRYVGNSYYRWRFNDLSCFEAIGIPRSKCRNILCFCANCWGQACLLTAGHPFFFQPSLTDGTDLPNTQMKVNLVHEVYKVGFYYWTTLGPKQALIEHVLARAFYCFGFCSMASWLHRNCN